MRNLLITTIGEYNHFSTWADGSRGYDLYCIDYRITPGFKYPLIAEALKRYLTYDYYWMPDEDIYATPEQINAIFDRMAALDLLMGQPSVERSDTSFPSWELFVHKDDGTAFHPTRFVEIMCPAFSHEALMRCIDTFSKSRSGWGLDLAWAKILGYQRMGYFNDVAIRHTRKPMKGSRLYGMLPETPGKEMRRVMNEYGITQIDVR